MPSLDWGDVPTALSAVLTGVAVVIAALVYRADSHERRRAHAARVAAWLEIPEDPAQDLDVRVLHILNGSDRVIRDVEVIAEDVETEPYRLDLLPPGVDHRANASPALTSRLEQIYTAPLILRFTDDLGRRWERGGSEQTLRLAHT